jgi:hypothetical protein
VTCFKCGEPIYPGEPHLCWGGIGQPEEPKVYFKIDLAKLLNRRKDMDWKAIWAFIWEAIFGYKKPDPKPDDEDTKPDPKPDPIPPTPPDPVPDPIPVVKHIIIADMDLIPERMRHQGWAGSNNELWYALCHTYAGREWFDPYNNPISTALYTDRDRIYQWWDAYVLDIAGQMRANPGLTATVIVNDKNDAGGLYLGPPTMEKLREFGDRVVMGQIYNPWGL